MEQAEKKEMAYILHMLQTLVTGGNMHTVEDILALPEGKRAELIDGEMFMMASPTWTHQQILGWLYIAIFSHIRSNGGKCKVGLAPFAVFLKKDNKNYVEPDLAIICDSGKIDDQGCHGAPDWVIEIVSPSSIVMDYQRKREAYKYARVREYWIIDPLKGIVTVHHFEPKQGTETYMFSDTVESGILDGLKLDFRELQEFLS